MKELLEKITRSTVTITFKSGERDKLEDVVIEAVIGNVVIANYRGKLTVIEIPHIAYISVDSGVLEVMEDILNSKKGEEKQENKDGNKENK